MVKLSMNLNRRVFVMTILHCMLFPHYMQVVLLTYLFAFYEKNGIGIFRSSTIIPLTRGTPIILLTIMRARMLT